MKQKLLTFLALALLAVPAASPYFLPGVPYTNDLPSHLSRSYFFRRAVEWGGLWPRWSPDLVFGHGYPVFNFFPSLFHWVVNLVHMLGLPLTTAYRLVIYAHFLGAAAAGYFLGRVIFKSQAAGWGAALVFTYSPYLLYDAHVRGSGPETQALALLPLLILALWKASELPINDTSFRQSLISNLQSPFWLLATAVFFILALLSHPIIYQLLIPIGVWLLIKALFARQHGRFWNTLIGPALGIGVGVLLTTFYWLPAFLEVQYTYADTSINQGYAYQTNFLTLMDLLRWPRLPADPSLINPPVVRPLPVIGLIWAAVVILWRWRKMTQTHQEIVAAWTAVLLLCIWLMTPGSQFVWDNFPLLRLTFYPWRLLGMASVSTAVLVALSMREIADWRVEANFNLQSPISRLPVVNLLPSLLLTILIITTSIPWLYPPRYPTPEVIDLAEALRDELPPFIIGTTTLGEFLPRWVEELPPQEPAQSELIVADNPDRLQSVDGLTWTQLKNNPIYARYAIQVSQSMTITYGQFYFPGWEAVLDGASVPIQPSKPHGLISLAVPAGEHELHITFTNSPSRWLGWGISFFALVVCLLLIGWAIYNRRLIPAGPARSDSPDLLPGRYLVLLGITAVLIWLLFTYVNTPLRRPTLLPDGVWGKQTITPLDYAGELRLLTYEQSTAEIAADVPIKLDLYWQPQRSIGVPYKVGVQIVDADGLVWSDHSDRPSDWRFLGTYWPIEQYQLDPFVVTLMDGAPPGGYQFHVGLVRGDTGQTVAAYDIGGFRITEPANGERPLEPGMKPAPASAVTGGLRLLGSRLDRNETAPGDPARITALWQVVEETAVTNQFTLQLVNADGEITLIQPVTIAPDYPLVEWRADDRLRSETTLRLPAGTPDGTHTWQILWGDQTIDIGTLAVTAPKRIFDTPSLDYTVDTAVGDLTVLLGVNLGQPSSPGSPLEVTLVWYAETETPTSYRAFVHLIDSDDQIITQSDGEPVNWTRPTTSWLPGEIILDTHLLNLPPDLSAETPRLRIGLYDPATGQRLPTPTGDFIIVEIDE